MYLIAQLPFWPQLAHKADINTILGPIIAISNFQLHLWRTDATILMNSTRLASRSFHDRVSNAITELGLGPITKASNKPAGSTSTGEAKTVIS
jgi:hypothetical protein